MPEGDPDFSADVTQPVQQRPGTNPSAPSSSHYAVELPYAEELQAMLEGRYIVEGFLGQGGMGAVYKGLQLPLKRPVAIKILQKKQAGAEEDDFAFEERFKREAYAMAALTHPNIVQVYDCGDAGDNFLFISMELLQGGDLSDAIKAGQCTPEIALKLIGQICDGLQAAHERGIVHRDIKPANIFLTADGRAKVADFGLAKKFDAKSTFVTKTGLGMGTPDYAAPEQYEPELGLDHRADIYALGVMMYQMLTGKLPRGVYKMPSQMVPIDPRIDAVVSRAMMSDRDDRWQSAAEIKQALQAIAAAPAKPAAAPAPAPVRTSAVPTAARTVPTGATQRPAALQPARGPVAQTPGASRPMPAPAPAQPAKKSSALLLAGVVGLATVVALGGFFMMKKPSAKAPSAAAPVPTQAGTTGLPPSTTGETWVDGLAKWWASPHNIAGGLLVKTADGSTFSRRGDLIIDGKMENVVVRATVRKINWYAEVRALGSGDQPGAQDSLVFGLMVRNDGELSLIARNYKVSNSGRDLLRRRMPPGFAKDARYELEVRVENGTATALLNGEQVASGPVSKGRGGVILAGGEGMIVEKFEYMDLGAIMAPVAVGTPAGARAEFGGHRYELAKGALTWDEARARAEAMGGHLATVTSREEDEFIKRVFRDGIKVSNHAWIGASRAIGSPEWKWVTGEVLNFKAWAVGQPDVKIDYGAAASYWRREEGIVGWDDTPGSDTRRESFLVEWDEARPPVQGTVNLLADVDVNRGRVDGSWSMRNGELVGNGGFARLSFNHQPPAEYDFRVRFTRPGGNQAVAQHVVMNGHDAMWIMGGFSNSACGFEQVDGAKAKENATTVNSGIENGRIYESVVKVRRNQLQVLLDGKLVVDYKTDGSNLSANPKWAFPEAGKLGLGCQQETVFHSVEIIPVGATPQPAVAAAPVPAGGPSPASSELPPAPTTPRQTIDLIASLDLAKDRMPAGNMTKANEWTKTGTVLTYKSDGNSGKVIAPVSLAGLKDYEVGVIVLQMPEGAAFTINLPISASRQAGVVFNRGGIVLGMLNGERKKIGDWPRSVRDDARVLTRLRLAPDGNRGTITVTINNEVAAQWEGALADVGKAIEPHSEFPGQPTTGIFCFKDGLDFTVWQLRVYEGEAQLLRDASGAPLPVAMPSAAPAATEQGGAKPLSLFDGVSLAGWQSAPEGAFTVEDGAMKTSAKGNIVFTGTAQVRPPWRDFELTMQVKSSDRANSGVWVHCPSTASAVSAFALEIQIDNTPSVAQMTGSIFGVTSASKPPPKNGEWFEMKVRVKDRTVTVLVDGEVINEWTQPENWSPPSKVPNARLGQGSIGFQSYGGTVLIKDIMITAP